MGNKGYYMPLSELMEVYDPAYGGDWLSAMDGLLSDPHEARVIEDLTKELDAYSEFEEPISLERIEDAEPGEKPRVLNGMHRITAVAHSHWKVPNLWVMIGYPEDIYMGDEVAVTSITVENINEWSEEEEDAVFCGVRSFPMGSHWMESAFTYRSGNVFELCWHGEPDETLYGEITGEVFSRLKKQVGEDIKFSVTTHTIVEEFDEDDLLD